MEILVYDTSQLVESNFVYIVTNNKIEIGIQCQIQNDNT